MKYYMIAGEASGDLHGSNLLKGLFANDPDAQVRFWGGDLMAGVTGPDGRKGTLVRHYKEGAVMGITDILAKARKLVGNVSFCKKDILQWAPDVVILIDYPGFNFKIAKFAHDNGIRTYYYIAPKTWASREGRNRKLRRDVDRLFIVFPFEIPYFQSKGIPFTYVGNPLLDAVDNAPDGGSPLGDGKRYVALLAGSRKGEISRMMKVFMMAADILHGRDSSLEFVIAGAPSRDSGDYETAMAGRPYVHLVFGRTYDVLRHSCAAVINSGTASLEAALLAVPQVVCYAFSPVTMALARLLVKVKYISLGNLIVDRLAFRELIQEQFTPQAVADEVARLMDDSAYRNKMLSDYSEIRERLGGKGASDAVASAMIEDLRKNRQ